MSRTLALVAFLLVAFGISAFCQEGGNKIGVGRRHLGWFLVKDKIEASVTIKYDSSSILVEIQYSGKDVSFSKDLQAWILVKNSAIVPNRTDTARIYETHYLLLHADSNSATPIGVVLKLDGVLHTFPLQSRTAGASDEAQYLIDQLLATPRSDQEAFETSKSTADSVPHVRIGNLKQQLSKMAVEVNWSSESKSYQIKTKQSDRERQIY